MILNKDEICCQICLMEVENDKIEPCKCRGTVGKYHMDCLKKWVQHLMKTGKIPKCYSCKFEYNLSVSKFVCFIEIVLIIITSLSTTYISKVHNITVLYYYINIVVNYMFINYFYKNLSAPKMLYTIFIAILSLILGFLANYQSNYTRFIFHYFSTIFLSFSFSYILFVIFIPFFTIKYTYIYSYSNPRP